MINYNDKLYCAYCNKPINKSYDKYNLLCKDCCKTKN